MYYNFSHIAIFLPKFIKIGGNVTEFQQKQKCSLFETRCIHCVQKKTPTYIFNYDSGISWSIFINFVPVKREINTIQFTYLLHGVKDEHWTTLLKNTHFCLNYNSGVSWSIFILFDLMETGMNILQRINKIYKITIIVSPHYITQKHHILRRPWPTASWSAFDRTRCLQLSQKAI